MLTQANSLSSAPTDAALYRYCQSKLQEAVQNSRAIPFQPK
jgi:hypothetical protein